VPYDEYNMYNIFEHQLKVRKKGISLIKLQRCPWKVGKERGEKGGGAHDGEVNYRVSPQS
jgi:hypothetical protein